MKKFLFIEILILNILLLASLLKDTVSEYPNINLREEVDNAKKVNEIQDYYKVNEKFLRPRLIELSEKLREFFKLIKVIELFMFKGVVFYKLRKK